VPLHRFSPVVVLMGGSSQTYCWFVCFLVSFVGREGACGLVVGGILLGPDETGVVSWFPSPLGDRLLIIAIDDCWLVVVMVIVGWLCGGGVVGVLCVFSWPGCACGSYPYWSSVSVVGVLGGVCGVPGWHGVGWVFENWIVDASIVVRSSVWWLCGSVCGSVVCV
jgi:hypothetical protein